MQPQRETEDYHEKTSSDGKERKNERKKSRVLKTEKEAVKVRPDSINCTLKSIRRMRRSG